VAERPNVHADALSLEFGTARAESVLAKAGAELLGGTLYELPPGADGVPLHIHHSLEEAVVVISGHPTLQTLEGETGLEPGDVVAFPRGRRGAHTLHNRSQEPARYLMISTKSMPEIVEYPELGTVRVLTRAPFSPAAPDEDPADRIMLTFDRDDAK
jgi:uncharacterized cupin superfamily protein